MLRINTFGGLSLRQGDAPLTGAPSQRRRLALLAILAAAGDQGVSGYDVFSKLTEFREKLKPPDTKSTSIPHNASPRTQPPDLPLSVRPLTADP